MLGFGGAYVAVLIPFLMWLAAWTASVPPAPGAMPVPKYRLKPRIRSLAAAGLDVRIETPPGQTERLPVARDFRGGRRSMGMRQIGGASGRDRVSRNVSISVGAVELHKTKNSRDTRCNIAGHLMN